jgi:hypothetical protein
MKPGAHPHIDKDAGALVRLVDFKWLMAGVGWRVNLTRLQQDTAYFDECLHRAQTSDSALLREYGTELLGLGQRASPVA